MLLKAFIIIISIYLYRILKKHRINKVLKNYEGQYIQKHIKSNVNHINIEGVHVLKISKKPPNNSRNIVLIHGLAGSSLSYVNILDDLSVYYNVYAIDLPGFGNSTSDEKLSVDFYCNIIENILEKLNIKDTIICGHSFGAYLSIKYLQKYSKRVNGLVLLCPAGLFPALGIYAPYYGLLFKLSVTYIGKYISSLFYFLIVYLLKLIHIFKDSTENLYWFHLLGNPTNTGDEVVANKIVITRNILE